MITFGLDKDHFVRNGAPHRVLSGALHYFRIPADYWEDRIRKCRACGLNTIETYVAWNLHEPRKGEFHFDGELDLRRFIETVKALGMDLILRPGPYICAEWEFGGLPWWLLSDSDVQVRCTNSAYLGHVSSYFDSLFEEVGDLLCTRGGPIVAVQIENEYGSYGTDSEYLSWIERALIERGVDVLLFTSDGPEDAMLQGGTLPHVFKTANFGSRAKDAFLKLREYQPSGPLVCMEFWNGWFDSWGGEHCKREPRDAVAALDEILSLDASVNIYMMHGGTNFGYMNGALGLEEYSSIVTSYDYDAPLDEQGNPTEKFVLFREVLKKHGAHVHPIPERTSAKAFGIFAPVGCSAAIGEIVRSSEPILSVNPRKMEDLGRGYGFVHYRTRISGPRPEARLYVDGVHDRALILVDGVRVAILERKERQLGVPVSVPSEGAVLEILVENLGRINYGPRLADRKGIQGCVRLDNQALHHWEMRTMETPDFNSLIWRSDVETTEPLFYKYEVDILKPEDTFLKVSGGVHGIVWLNGRTLGRYWSIGPQHALYVPAPFLRFGVNSVVLLETDAADVPSIEFCAHGLAVASCTME